MYKTEVVGYKKKNKNYVARPQRFRGQGKYLKCIYL